MRGAGLGAPPSHPTLPGAPGFGVRKPATGRFPLSWTLASGPTPCSAPVPGVEGSLPDTSDPRPLHPLAGAPTRTPFSSFFPRGRSEAAGGEETPQSGEVRECHLLVLKTSYKGRWGLSLQTYTWSVVGRRRAGCLVQAFMHPVFFFFFFFGTYCVPGVPWEGPARQCRRPGWGGATNLSREASARACGRWGQHRWSQVCLQHGSLGEGGTLVGSLDSGSTGEEAVSPLRLCQ